MDAEDFGLIGALLLIVIVVAGLAVYIPIDASTGRRCLAAGYPHGRVTYALERYCIKRVDQTDMVIPLAVAERTAK